MNPPRLMTTRGRHAAIRTSGRSYYQPTEYSPPMRDPVRRTSNPGGLEGTREAPHYGQTRMSHDSAGNTVARQSTDIRGQRSAYGQAYSHAGAPAYAYDRSALPRPAANPAGPAIGSLGGQGVLSPSTIWEQARNQADQVRQQRGGPQLGSPQPQDQGPTMADWQQMQAEQQRRQQEAAAAGAGGAGVGVGQTQSGLTGSPQQQGPTMADWQQMQAEQAPAPDQQSPGEGEQAPAPDPQQQQMTEEQQYNEALEGRYQDFMGSGSIWDDAADLTAEYWVQRMEEVSRNSGGLSRASRLKRLRRSRRAWEAMQSLEGMAGVLQVSPEELIALLEAGFTFEYKDYEWQHRGLNGNLEDWHDEGGRENSGANRIIQQAQLDQANDEFTFRGDPEEPEEDPGYQEALDRILGNEAPEFDTSNLDQLNLETRRRTAQNTAIGMSTILEGNARARGAAGRGTAEAARLATDVRTEGDRQIAQQNLQADIQNYQAQLAHYQYQMQALQSLLNQELDAETRADALEAQKALNEHATLLGLEIANAQSQLSGILQGVGTGAATGATIGSVAGPWGTAIGAVGGGIAGGILGGLS